MLMIFLAALDTEEEKIKMTELYDEHKLPLMQIALKMTKNQAMAEDAVHNTFWAAIRHKEKVFALSCRDFRGWSVITVRGKCIDLMRKEKYYSDTSFDEMDSFIPADDKPIDLQVIRQAEYKKIREYISRLDEISGQVLDMKYVLDMSYKEIGDELGMTPKHVDTCIYRAKAKIRKLIESEAYFDEQQSL